MRQRLATVLTAVVIGLSSTIAAHGQDPKPADKPASDKSDPLPAKFIRHHTLRIGASDLAYTTTAEDIYLKDGDGKSTADFFTISYVKEGIPASEPRPLTFVFNGGP